MSKRALCIGIGYDSGLAGTLSDVKRFSQLLSKHFGYIVTTMRDDGNDTTSSTYPSRKNILAAIDDLAASANQGDYLVFFYTGHGAQVADTPGAKNEEDRKDEALLPRDYKDGNPETYILDDVIRSRLVNPVVEKAAHIVLVFDCCHSGTAADLDNMIEPKKRTRAFQLGHSSTTERAAYDARAVSWGACPDADVTSAPKSGGLFTTALVDALQVADSKTTHEAMRQQVQQRMVDRMKKEIPQMSASARWARCQPQLEFLEHNSLGSLPVLEAFGIAPRTH